METSERFTETRPNNLGGGNYTGTETSNTEHSLADATGPTIDRLASGAHKVVDNMADVIAQAAETLDVKGEQLNELQGRWLENSRVYIRDHPIKSLGIAVVGGFLLSRLLSSR